MPDCLPLTRYGSLLGKAPAGTLPGVGRVRAAAGFGAGWRQVRVPGGKGDPAAGENARGILFTAGVSSWCERVGHLWAWERRHPAKRSRGRIRRALSWRPGVRVWAGIRDGSDERLA